MGDFVQPKQDPNWKPPAPSSNNNSPRPSGGGGRQIVIGAIMLVAGIGLSVAGTGRVFVGLIAVGAITLVRGLAAR